MKRAWISVSDKTGLAELAQELQKQGVEIVSAGETQEVLTGEGLKVTNPCGVASAAGIRDAYVLAYEADPLSPFGGVIAAIIQPGGSVRDQEWIDACNKYGIAMVFTGMRHFKH